MESRVGAVVSVNVSMPRPMEFNGETIYSGIFKLPVTCPVMVRTLNIDGDGQADLVNHGGLQKAVYFYPHEHYPLWASILGVDDLVPGALGENFTSSGVLENDVYIGDRWRVGTATVEITQPRSPCYKLGLKYGRPDLIPRFLTAMKPGFYAAVIEEGVVNPNDTMELVWRADVRITVEDVFRLALAFTHEPELRSAIGENDLIPDFWKQKVIAHGAPGANRGLW
jgi:MOSC domain-containing protein YiiM